MRGTRGLLGGGRRGGGPVRQIRRVREIAGILLKYGLGELAAMLLTSPRFRFMGRLLSRKNRKVARELDRWQRIRRALEELGPTFIKLGQILSSRRDLLPEGLVRELSKLQDEVPPFPFPLVRKIIEEETGRPAAEVFPGLEPRPEASASIAQVHRARLEDGSQVAVKVRRPDIQEQIEVDIQILERVADLAERTLPAARLFNPRRVVQEFKRQIGRELDLSVELLNIEKFRALMRDRSDLYVPCTYDQTSSEAVLVMEYVQGRRLGDILDDPGSVEDPGRIPSSLADLALEQIFGLGFFHADPHAGNIRVLEDGRICYLDFGIVGFLSEGQRELLNRLLYGISKGNARLLSRTLLQLTTPLQSIDPRALEIRVDELLETYLDLPLRHLDLSGIFTDLIDLVVSFRLQLPQNVNLMIKTLVLLEGIGRALDPGFMMIDRIRPYAAGFFLRRYAPGRLLERLSLFSLDAEDLLAELPIRTREVLSQLAEGEARVNIDFAGLDRFCFVLDAVSNRLVFGLILAALLVSSSLIVLAGIAPKWQGIPVIGLAGYLIAAAMGFGFVVAWLRKSAAAARGNRRARRGRGNPAR
ncbi:MAG: hypothetical protein JW820_14905 [Spirochaetales bacterium]|nr:hypothetical protein [Spirochaetales bacterium]